MLIKRPFQRLRILGKIFKGFISLVSGACMLENERNFFLSLFSLSLSLSLSLTHTHTHTHTHMHKHRQTQKSLSKKCELERDRKESMNYPNFQLHHSIKKIALNSCMSMNDSDVHTQHLLHVLPGPAETPLPPRGRVSAVRSVEGLFPLYCTC